MDQVLATSICASTLALNCHGFYLPGFAPIYPRIYLAVFSLAFMNMFKPEIGVGRTWFPFYLNDQSPSLGHFSLLVDRRRVSGAGTIHLVPCTTFFVYHEIRF